MNKERKKFFKNSEVLIKIYDTEFSFNFHLPHRTVLMLTAETLRDWVFVNMLTQAKSVYYYFFSCYWKFIMLVSIRRIPFQGWGKCLYFLYVVAVILIKLLLHWVICIYSGWLEFPLCKCIPCMKYFVWQLLFLFKSLFHFDTHPQALLLLLFFVLFFFLLWDLFI